MIHVSFTVGFPSVFSDEKFVVCANANKDNKLLNAPRKASVRIEKLEFCGRNTYSIWIDMLPASSYYQLQHQCTTEHGRQYNFVQFTNDTTEVKWNAVRLCNFLFVRSHFDVFQTKSSKTSHVKTKTMNRSTWFLNDGLYSQDICDAGKLIHFTFRK